MNRIMNAATVYKNILGIPDMSDCMDTDPRSSQWIRKGIDEMWKLVIHKYELFDKPDCCEGYPFSKGSRLFIACMLHTGWDIDTATAKLDSLLTYRDINRKIRGISKVPNTSRNVYNMEYYNLYTNSKIRETLGNVEVAWKTRKAEIEAENERWWEERGRRG